MLIWVLSAAKENRFWQLLTVLGIVLFVLAGLVALFVKGTPEEDGCYPDNDPAVAEMLKNEEIPVEAGAKFSYKDAIKNKYVWVFGIGIGFFFFIRE